MDLKSGIDKFGLNPEDINDLYDELSLIHI